MFSDNLVQLRKLNDMTQEELAEAVGVTRQAIAKWRQEIVCLISKEVKL